LSTEAPLCESIAALGISIHKLTAGRDLYPAAAETRWQNFATARCSRLCLHLNEFHVRKQLEDFYTSQRSEELRLYNLVKNLTASNSGLKAVSSNASHG
jgi:hypothetical protein